MHKRIIETLCFIILTFVILIIILVFEKNVQSSANVWVGEYEYSEFYPPNITRNYLITIYESGNDLDAHIRIDGFQTLKRYRTEVWSRGNEIQFVFVGYYTDINGRATEGLDNYKKGDLMLTLKKENNTYLIEWNEMTPMLDENKLTKQYFEKIK